MLRSYGCKIQIQSQIKFGVGALGDGSNRRIGSPSCSGLTTRKRMRPDPTSAKATKAVASRFYQLRTGHALIGPYLKEIGNISKKT